MVWRAVAAGMWWLRCRWQVHHDGWTADTAYDGLLSRGGSRNVCERWLAVVARLWHRVRAGCPHERASGTGAVFATTRRDGMAFKRLSSVCREKSRGICLAHAGYILIGLAVSPYSSLGLQGSLYHILNHAVMKGMAFIAVTGIITTLAVTHIDKLKGLGRRMPITALGLIISLFALAGVPPLAGFWSKLVLFGGALDAGTSIWWAPWLAIAGVLNSALSLAYYGWITRKMYFEGENEKRVSEPKSIIAIMVFSIVFLVGFGIYPDPIIKFVEFAAPTFSLGVMP